MALPTNVIKRGKSYYLRVMIEGKVFQRSLGTNLSAAKKRKDQLLMELRGEAPHTHGGMMTLEAFSKVWMEEFIQQRRNPQNVQIASQRLSDHILPILGEVPLSEVSYQLLRRLRGILDASSLSSTTVGYILGDVRCLLRYAVEVGELRESPWRPSLMPEKKKLAPKRLSDEQVEGILRHTPDQYQLAVKLALLTGCRWGEIHKLKWSHLVDLPSPHLVLEQTKSGEVRRVPLSSEAYQLLKRERDVSHGEYVLSWRTAFPGTVVHWIGKSAGFKWNFHQLRHTFACRWLEAGGSKESLQKILGHSTIKLTERYGQLSDGAVAWEMERLQLGTGTVTRGVTNPLAGVR